jgi:hypothetical protein
MVLDPLALSATPYVYLIRSGSTRCAPALGDSSTVRTWVVEDVAIPMPFNIGASGFLHEAALAIRRFAYRRTICHAQTPGLPPGFYFNALFSRDSMVPAAPPALTLITAW